MVYTNDMELLGNVEPSEIRRIRFLSRLLDSAFTIPIIRKRIGFDAIIGFFPIVGDCVTVSISLYTVWIAYHLSLPKKVLAHMILNLLIDTSVGSIPVVGDWFDVIWKANQRNIELLEKAYYAKTAEAASPFFVSDGEAPPSDVDVLTQNVL